MNKQLAELYKNQIGEFATIVKAVAKMSEAKLEKEYNKAWVVPRSNSHEGFTWGWNSSEGTFSYPINYYPSKDLKFGYFNNKGPTECIISEKERVVIIWKWWNYLGNHLYKKSDFNTSIARELSLCKELKKFQFNEWIITDLYKIEPKYAIEWRVSHNM